MQQNALNELLLLPAYREQRQHIFPSQGSLDWYVRSHKPRLARDGAIVLIGRTWYAHESRFDETVLAIATDAASAMCGEVAA